MTNQTEGTGLPFSHIHVLDDRMDPGYTKVQWIHLLHRKLYYRTTAAVNKNYHNQDALTMPTYTKKSTTYTICQFGDPKQETKCHTLGTHLKHIQTQTYHNALHLTSTPMFHLTTNTSGKDWKTYNEYNNTTREYRMNVETLGKVGPKAKVNTLDDRDDSVETAVETAMEDLTNNPPSDLT